MTTYIASTGTIGDIVTGALWFVAVDDDQISVDNGSTWGINFNCRLKYMDC